MKKIILSKDKIYSGELILVNRDYPYRESEEYKTLTTIESFTKNKVPMEQRPATSYKKLIKRICAYNQIMAVSGWRSKQEQELLYSKSLMENGANFTSKYVAIPGHSEHQTGLAIDLALNQPDIDMLCPNFPYTGICKNFRKAAGRYGFIERYPKNKEHLTGIAHEPWHFRYVGAPHSLIIEQSGDSLEEYHTRLKEYTHEKKTLKTSFRGSLIEIFYIAADKEAVVFEVEDNTAFSASGNNIDGFVITIWRSNRR